MDQTHAPLLLAQKAPAEAGTVRVRRLDTMVDVGRVRALGIYRDALLQFLTVRVGGATAARVFRELRAWVAGTPSEVLSAAPGVRARVFRVARRMAREAYAAGNERPTVLWRAPRAAGIDAAALADLRARLDVFDAELLELRHARELNPTEIAFVMDVRPAEIDEAIARAEETARLALARPLRGRLHDALRAAFAVSTPKLPVERDVPTTADREAESASSAESTAIDAFRSGTVIGGRYAIDKRVGSGAFGDVYRARDTEVSGHVVALKLLHQPSASDEEKQRALRELRLIASVFHPSIVQFKDHGWHEERLWFVMPWYEGETLETRIEREPLTRAEARTIFEPLARALAAMHAAGIRHQDVKPDNIFLARLPGQDDVLPVLLDLGVAAHEAEMLFAGTPVYFAPEMACQFTGGDIKPTVGTAADVFSLALSLRNALEPDTQDDICSSAVEAFIEGRAIETPSAPTGRSLRYMRRHFERWLAYDPERRPSAAEFLDELDILTLPEERRARRRRALGKVVVFAAAAGLLGSFGIKQWREREAHGARLMAAARSTEEALRGDLETTRARAERLRETVAESRARHARLTGALASSTTRLESTRLMLNALNERGVAMRERAQEAESTLAAQSERLEGVEAQLAESRGELATRSRLLDEARDAVRDLEAGRRELERQHARELERERAAAGRVRESLATLQRERDAARERTTSLQRELEQARRDVQAARRERDAAVRDRAAATAALTRAVRERDAARERAPAAAPAPPAPAPRVHRAPPPLPES